MYLVAWNTGQQLPKEYQEKVSIYFIRRIFIAEAFKEQKYIRVKERFLIHVLVI